ncbi:MAG: aminoglycoside phosphotransferase family protein, partial [Actinobacteria bacterium]|nr:aminoglycoside phosphotransferase family protein [Actinomycetota bacterium]
RVARLGTDQRAVTVLRAGRSTERDLAAGGPQPAGALVHGDWHLGQLGRDAAGRWLLLDLDDLGVGDQAWDLGRPAGFWAAGLLDDASWTTFLAAYRAAGGPAVPSDGDPWPRLDLPARAEVVVAAARAVHRAHHGAEEWDDTAEALLVACARM